MRVVLRSVRGGSYAGAERGRWTRGIAAAILLILGARGVAEAHPRVLHSEPAAGARLGSAPPVVRLQFSEAIEVSLARLTLIAAHGDTVSLSPLRRGPGGADAVEADVLGRLIAGTYQVTWRITGKDGHPVTGRFEFVLDSATRDTAGAGVKGSESPNDSARAETVPAAPLGSGETTASASEGESGVAASLPSVAVKWLGYAALLLVIGVAAFVFLVLPRVDFVASAPHSPWLDEAAVQARRLGWYGALALIVIAPLRLIGQVTAVTGGETSSASALHAIFLHTLWGHAWALQLVAAIVVLLALRPRAVPDLQRPSLALLVPGILGLAVAAALSGHAVSAARAPASVAVILDALHVLGAGVWVGALLALVGAGIPAALRLPRLDRGGAARALLSAFSAPALTGAALLALSGAGSAWVQLGSLSALGTSTYGRVLLLKLGVVLLVLAAGAWNWRVVQPSLASPESAGRARTSAAVEATLMAVVLLVTAILTSTPPPAVP